ncbi:MAG: hypothetical protein ACK40X_00855 [Armatimonadota bacterium]
MMRRSRIAIARKGRRYNELGNFKRPSPARGDATTNLAISNDRRPQGRRYIVLEFKLPRPHSRVPRPDKNWLTRMFALQ